MKNETVSATNNWQLDTGVLTLSYECEGEPVELEGPGPLDQAGQAGFTKML